LALPRNSELLGRSAFFRGITETIPSIFRGIFSERNSVPNPICKTFIGKKAENFAVFTLDKLQEFHASFPKTFYEHSYANSYAQLEKFCFCSYQLHIKLNKNWNSDPLSTINFYILYLLFSNHLNIKLTASTRMCSTVVT
jgi:hypothetical protein